MEYGPDSLRRRAIRSAGEGGFAFDRKRCFAARSIGSRLAAADEEAVVPGHYRAFACAVDVAEVTRLQVEVYFARFAWLQRDARESDQRMAGRKRAIRICEVRLHHFVAGTIADVAHSRTHSQCCAGS